jgi:dCTP deaminase
MPFWSDETWRSIPDASAPVEPFDRDHLEEAKYIMAIGDEVYISSSGEENTIRKLAPRESFSIAPGQFAYILTQEIVRMPADAIGFISINATIKFYGLVNISGFHVDPGYNGRIIFSVFNAGPIVIHLKQGDRIFPLWVAALDKPNTNLPPSKGYFEIPARLITAVSGHYTTAFELDAVVRKLRVEIDETKLDVATLKATRVQLLVLVAILSLLFGGILTVGSKFVLNWIADGQPFFNSAAAPQTKSAIPGAASQPSPPSSQAPITQAPKP